MTELPDPLTPADCDLRGIDPPWELFVQLAIATYGIDRAEAEAHVDVARLAYRAGGIGG